MDEERIISKFKEIEEYLEELDSIKPSNLEEYENSIEKKRACERLVQISIECVIDICNIIISESKFGIPIDEEDVFITLESKKVVSKEMKQILIEMKGMRNALVHKYGKVDNEQVFNAITDKLEDFEKFKSEILKFLKYKK